MPGRAELERYAPLRGDVVKTIHRKIAHDIDDRRQAFDKKRREITAKYSLHSSAYARAIDELVIHELEHRGRAVIAIRQTALSGQGRVLTPGIAEEIKRSIASVIGDGATDVREADLDAPTPGLTRNEAELKSLEARTQERLDTEVGFARIGGTMPSSNRSMGAPIMNDRSIHIQGSFTGNRRNGDGHGAIMATTPSGTQRNEIADALIRLRESLEDAEQANSEDVTALKETIDEAVAAVSKPKVNRLTLTGLFSGISGAVNTMSAIPQAADLTKARTLLLTLGQSIQW